MAFRPWSPAHLAVLLAIPAAAAALAWLVRRRPRAAPPVRLTLAAILVVNELAWYAYVWRAGWLDRTQLPLHLCSLMIWVTAAGLVTLQPLLLELGWFWGVAATTQALLTPDLAASLPAYPVFAFFLGHGLIVASALFVVLAGIHRPRPGAWLRALLLLLAYAAGLGAVNAALGTNYMYLAHKPASASALDLMGPWPWYILSGIAIAAAAFFLLDLPFRRGRRTAGR